MLSIQMSAKQAARRADSALFKRIEIYAINIVKVTQLIHRSMQAVCLITGTMILSIKKEKRTYSFPNPVQHFQPDYFYKKVGKIARKLSNNLL